MCLAIAVCRSDTNVVMSRLQPFRCSIHSLKARNSIAGLLPAWFLCKLHVFYYLKDSVYHDKLTCEIINGNFTCHM